MNSNSSKTTGVERWIVLVLGVFFLLFGISLAMSLGWEEGKKSFWVGIGVKLGAVLIALFLAWQNLAQLAKAIPRHYVIVLIVILLAAVIRPRIAIWFLLAAVVSLLGHYAYNLAVRTLKK